MARRRPCLGRGDAASRLRSWHLGSGRSGSARCRPRRMAQPEASARGAGEGDMSNRARVLRASPPIPGAAVSPALDQLCIDTLRMLAVDMVEKARSGHPGLPLGAAPMAYVLWS